MNGNSTSSRRRDPRRSDNSNSIWDHDPVLERRLLEDRINQKQSVRQFIVEFLEAILALAVLLFVAAVAIGALYL